MVTRALRCDSNFASREGTRQLLEDKKQAMEEDFATERATADGLVSDLAARRAELTAAL
jgi:hypothetical protein